MPLEDLRLDRVTSEDKERETESVPDVGDSEVAVIAECWYRLRELDEPTLARVMRYLNKRAETWHKHPSEDF